MTGVTPTMQPSTTAQPRRRRRRTLILVFDGLRPGNLRDGSMPNLQRFIAGGTFFVRSRTGFPSETMVGAGELFSGAYPERSGITANRMIIPGGDPRGVTIKDVEGLRRVEAAYGDTIPAQTLFDAFHGAGLTSAVVGKAGPAELAGMNGATWALSTEAGFDRTGKDLHSEATRRLGPAPERGRPDAQRSRWLRRAAQYVSETRRPDLLTVWFTDPDSTQHTAGLGSRDARSALQSVDREAGALLDALAASGELRDTNVVITSDHGFSDHANEHEIDLMGTLEKAGLRPTHVVASGNQHAVRFARQPTEAQIRQLRQAIARSPFADDVRAVIVAPRRGSRDRRGNRRLTAGDLMQGPERGGDVYVFYRRHEGKRKANVNPRPGSTVAGHGSLGWSDLNHTLVLVGPDFERGAVTGNPAAIVDVAPTLLRVNGVPVPPTMQGRVLREALRDGRPGVDPVPARRNAAVQREQLNGRTITTRLRTTHVGATQYFDGLQSNA